MRVRANSVAVTRRGIVEDVDQWSLWPAEEYASSDSAQASGTFAGVLVIMFISEVPFPERSLFGYGHTDMTGWTWPRGAAYPGRPREIGRSKMAWIHFICNHLATGLSGPS